MQVGRPPARASQEIHIATTKIRATNRTCTVLVPSTCLQVNAQRVYATSVGGAPVSTGEQTLNCFRDSISLSFAFCTRSARNRSSSSVNSYPETRLHSSATHGDNIGPSPSTIYDAPGPLRVCESIFPLISERRRRACSFATSLSATKAK